MLAPGECDAQREAEGRGAQNVEEKTTPFTASLSSAGLGLCNTMIGYFFPINMFVFLARELP